MTPRQASTAEMLRTPLDGPASWRGEELRTRRRTWVEELTREESGELVALARTVVEEADTFHRLDPRRFHAPALAARARRRRSALESGTGVLLLRGVPVAGHTPQQIAVMYWALGLTVGIPTPQDKRELYLAHVREQGRPGPDRFAYQTNVELPFHTDWCDVVSLLCVAPSPHGGTSRIASSVTVYNELLRRRPDLAEALYEPMWMNNKDEADGAKLPHYAASHISWLDGKLSFRRRPSWRRRAATDGRPEYLQPTAADGPPPPSAAQTRALELVDEIAREDGVALAMDLEAGDAQFINNHVILHARDAFQDGGEPHRKRHLMRLWLTVPGGRRLQQEYARGIARQSSLPGGRCAAWGEDA
ncbi:TauD/TfdA family dioxygenase [Kitasatospora purpeofusca]|uniref:TauD/TfdA family dioxygenase n=1 Tax=Kitasatospora purpeofusca TaxID=67352 RepID=UPI0036D3795C